MLKINKLLNAGIISLKNSVGAYHIHTPILVQNDKGIFIIDEISTDDGIVWILFTDSNETIAPLEQSTILFTTEL